MAKRDYYELLGIPKGATADEIKAAFRKAAAKHHPDLNPGDPQAAERFKELNEAHQVLSDPQKRMMFDRFGVEGGGAAGSPFAGGSPFGGANPFAGGGFPFGQGGVVDIGDIAVDGFLGDLLGVFGVGKGDKGDVKRSLEITFEEAAFGCVKNLSFERLEVCSDCTGSGQGANSRIETCPACSGKGRIRFQQGLLPLAVERECTRCKGRGRTIVDPCKGCHGAGLIQKTHKVEVTIPAGTDHGSAKVVPGAGSRPRSDRSPGDLLITIEVKPHPFFKRQGDDVVCTVPIGFPTAALGGEVAVPTLDGKGAMKVPAGTQPGATLRLKGKGIPRRTLGGRGDQLVLVSLEVPTKLTDHQKELLLAFATALGDDVQPEQRGFFDKLKDLFQD
jgi:molecular chaperone DnaJ